MTELKKPLLSTVTDYILPWMIYVDDTINAIKPGAVNHILKTLNNFHSNIKFTHELKNDGRLPFLGILVIPGENDIETTIYRKPTNNEIYRH